MNIWFSSDTHYGHERIIELAKRPFSSVEEMDEVMIERHNARVRPGDQFFHVGDFAFADHDPYLSRLNGQKFLVPAAGGAVHAQTSWPPAIRNGSKAESLRTDSSCKQPNPLTAPERPRRVASALTRLARVSG
jgi:hypothetical protein